MSGNLYASGLPTGSGFAQLLSLVGGQLTKSYTTTIYSVAPATWTSPVQYTGVYLICASTTGYSIYWVFYLFSVTANQGSRVINISSSVTVTCNNGDSGSATYTLPCSDNYINHQLIQIA